MKTQKMNVEVRRKIAAAGLYHYEIAQHLGLAPVSFARWMQREMDSEQKERVLQAIEEASRD